MTEDGNIESVEATPTSQDRSVDIHPATSISSITPVILSGICLENNNICTKVTQPKADAEAFTGESLNAHCVQTRQKIDRNGIKQIVEEKTIDGNEGNYGRLKPPAVIEPAEDKAFVAQIKWPDLAVQLFVHIGCVYGMYLVFMNAMFYTTVFAFCTIYTSGFGITAGVHRLWSHRSYKAKWPLRLILVLLFTITGQRDAYTWALDHRVHHKYTETDADPHNCNRGFFFAHVGWVVLTPHPKVVEKRKLIDVSDLEEDAIVMWQKRYYLILFPLLAIILPVYIPVYFWNEILWNSFWVNFNARFCITLNIAFFVNSVAHMWGQKPYDKYITSVESFGVSVAALGEGWHNYHHVFPWDYKTGELGNKWNPSTHFINLFAKIGWAYDLKSASANMIIRRARKTGDGTPIWGYGDQDIEKDELKELQRMEREKNL